MRNQSDAILLISNTYMSSYNFGQAMKIKPINPTIMNTLYKEDKIVC